MTDPYFWALALMGVGALGFLIFQAFHTSRTDNKAIAVSIGIMATGCVLGSIVIYLLKYAEIHSG